MKKFKGTKGKFGLSHKATVVTDENGNGIARAWSTYNRNKVEVKKESESWLDMRERTAHIREAKEEEQMQNAGLILDAFNTANECGLMPSELLRQRNELLEFTSFMVSLSNESDGVAGYHFNGDISEWREFGKEFDRAIGLVNQSND